jgi:hypothetical protein
VTTFIKKEVFVDALRFSVVDQSNIPSWMTITYDDKKDEWFVKDAKKQYKVTDSDWVLYDLDTIIRMDTDILFRETYKVDTFGLIMDQFMEAVDEKTNRILNQVKEEMEMVKVKEFYKKKGKKAL